MKPLTERLREAIGSEADALRDASLMREAADEIDRLQSARRWIPVSERTPAEDWSWVLIWWAHAQQVDMRVWGNVKQFLPLISHWQPLPEPPAESEGV